MKKRLARQLVELNNRFYAGCAESFSATRSAPWQGWGRVLDVARTAGALDAGGPRVLDVACGNLRFERFCVGELPDADLKFVAVDSCAELADLGEQGTAREPECAGESRAGGPHVDFRCVDVLARMLDGAPALAGIEGGFDLVVCFGFFHHVPGRELRERLLVELVRATRPGGVMAISLWRFMDDPRLARKAAAMDARALAEPPFPGLAAGELEPGDHFLGWQDRSDLLRYCHHFNEAEVDSLATSAAPIAREIARLSADGASGALNRYLVLRRTA